MLTPYKYEPYPIHLNQLHACTTMTSIRYFQTFIQSRLKTPKALNIG